MGSTMKSENDMTDDELEEWDAETRVTEDVLDKLEELRRFLNLSRVEQMYHIKRSTKLGPMCPYYKKARNLFLKNELPTLKSLLSTIEPSELDKLND